MRWNLREGRLCDRLFLLLGFQIIINAFIALSPSKSPSPPISSLIHTFLIQITIFVLIMSLHLITSIVHHWVPPHTTHPPILLPTEGYIHVLGIRYLQCIVYSFVLMLRVYVLGQGQHGQMV